MPDAPPPGPPLPPATPSRASVGSRGAAYIFDLLVLVLLWTIGAAWAAIAHPGTLPSPTMLATAGVGWVLSEVLYFALFEAVLRGQTPGKRAVGIRVVDRTGAAPGVGAVVLRNVLRLIDTLPFGYAVGTLLVVQDARSCRLGDRLAGTHVVHEPAPAVEPPPLRLPVDPTPAEHDIFQTWAARQPTLHPRARHRLALQLATWIDGRWPGHLPEGPTPEDRLHRGLQPDAPAPSDSG